MRVRGWLSYYRYPYSGQREFYAAVCNAASFEALPDAYRQAILDAEAEVERSRVRGRKRIAYWLALVVVGPLFVAVVVYAALMLFSVAFTPVPSDAVQPPPDVVPVGFILGVAVAAGLAKAWKALYYGLWPEREVR